ncbi:lysozyme 1 [Lingula anatina]|uniref:Lysozyme 1 n=1 Tax=Lingula anatina TaxID=7574 RepID=A0A1S3KGF4_LINAN|nr:lysozyme 1 [Lingula anatina]|eukprot:XP_013421539.1 lysozyme 1 [Lingula anatina]
MLFVFGVLAIVSLHESAALSDSVCHGYRAGATCQVDALFCSGWYVRGKCSGAYNRKCCVPGYGDRRCTSQGGTCKFAFNSCSGYFKTGLCAGPTSRRCCTSSSSSSSSSGIGKGKVDYQGYAVSDADVRRKLQAIANLYGKRVYLFSGDRPHQSNSRSHHYFGRAADFWIEGEGSGRAIFNRLRSSGILARDYQVIWHGRDTCTGGEHIHIGHYGDNRRTCWVIEGTSHANKCSYNCQ